jgi:3-hydroxyacyl-CoA dehydrogenase
MLEAQGKDASQPLVVAVLGAGLMGAHIASDFARAGHTVRFTVSARTPEAAALARVSSAGAAAGDLSPAGDLAIGYARDTSEAAESADLVVESLSEDLVLKQRELRIAQETAPGAILTTNTSSLTIASIAAGLDDPRALIGMHYVNPPWAHRIVEVIPSDRTAPTVVEAIDRILLSLGRIPIHVNEDVPGLVFNRLQFALLREAIDLVDRGVVTKEELDRVVVEGLGRRWGIVGPFAAAGLGGPDLFYGLAERLYPTLSASTSPSPRHRRHLAVSAAEIALARETRDAGLAAYVAPVAEPVHNPVVQLSPAPTSS